VAARVKDIGYAAHAATALIRVRHCRIVGPFCSSKPQHSPSYYRVTSRMRITVGFKRIFCRSQMRVIWWRARVVFVRFDGRQRARERAVVSG